MATVDLASELHRLYGFDGFRGLQQAVIEHHLGGGSALVLMATGEGKSLCYQLPAFVGEGLTLVVSPLIALMDDQVQALQARDLPATCIHSMLERKERERRLAAVQRGEIRLLYVTPERFRVKGFLAALNDVKIARLAVDEAHCVSHWGHDFRPEYRRLGEVREQLGNPPCLALTATATPTVQSDIRTALRLENAQRFCTGIERDNLFLSVAPCHTDDDKRDRLLEVLRQTGGPAIVYCALIKDLLRLESELLREGIKPLVYHGDLSAHERRTQQAAFQERDDALILATNAFGMGVDKADIRAIVHWQIPRTLEAYYQEVGRAGRDGQGSFCELLYREEDLVIQRNFTEWANPTAEFAEQIALYMQGQGDRLHALDLDTLRDTFLTKQRHDGRVETVLRLLRTGGCLEGEIGRDLQFVRMPTAAELAEWLPDDKKQRDLMGLLAMVRYASEAECRKRTIHAHFGFEESADGTPTEEWRCGTCDLCTATAEWQSDHLPTPRGIQSATAGTGEAPVRRGDWLETRKFGLCCVARVHRRGKHWRVDVELARDLSSRSFNLRDGEWRRVESN
ncbi:MAG: RecQ family ATP-dependent DNA helicase [bacterium]|nr:RecQ family ATP-dependent DNA helicase [bacterium]